MKSPHRRSIGSQTLLALLVLSLPGFSGCRSQPLINPSPIASSLGAEQNRLAALRGLMTHRWSVASEEPGRLTAKLGRSGKHIAVVDIRYDDRTISIRYRSSTGLRCEPKGDSCSSIHRAYNRWVVQLARDIDYAVQMVHYETLRQGGRYTAQPSVPNAPLPEE